jgi:uncharacterized protein (DUF1015 family)
MLRISAFQGLRPAENFVEQVACVPYDVVDTKEARVLAEGNPLSLLHVDRAEIDLPPEIDIYSDAVYQKALANFQKLQDDGVLIRESEPCVYLYRQRMGSHSQTGFVCVSHILDYESDLIKKHEKTRRDKEDDRTKLIDTISANTGPVFLTYRDAPAINALVEKYKAGSPLYDFTAPDGIQHTLWRIPGGQDLLNEFVKVPTSYVADGHHRTASAARVGRQRREANPEHTGKENYNWFLTVLFPASQLKILPYNRAVHDLNGHSPEDFLAAVKGRFDVVEDADPEPDQPGRVSMYLGGKWYGLSWSPDPDADPVGRLDVSVIQDRLLAPLLGIDDPRTSKRIDFVGGIRGTRELVKWCEEGRAAVAFSMYPTTVDQLMDIADAGQIMPPKSTWFEPKLRSGLVIHTLD